MPTLQAISESMEGQYYCITGSDEIPQAYGDALGGLLSVVARAVKVQVRYTLPACLLAPRNSHSTLALHELERGPASGVRSASLLCAHACSP